jgi:uncharacterized SAM-binding protein YcdF (DUF218 family)
MKKLLLFAVLLALAYGNPWTVRHYVAADSLRKVDAIVPLRGSPTEERIRLDHAADLIRQGYAPLLVPSVAGTPYYGQPMANIVEAYLESKKFPQQQVKLCENTADSTMEEAAAMLPCLQEAGARAIFVVTSEYHSRRARMIFRKTFRGSGIAVFVHPVYNEDYWSPYWWQRRRWAKTFLIETLAWVGNGVEQIRDWLRGTAARSGI